MESIQSLLQVEVVQIDIINLIMSMGLAVILSSLLALLFQYMSLSFSDRKGFSSTLILLTIAVVGIITVIKTSLALSLGLIGALSIVRFRTAVKEVEQLIFLFIAIGIGIALGAQQTMVAIMMFSVVSFVVIIRFFITKLTKKNIGSAHLLVKVDKQSAVLDEPILDFIERQINTHSLHSEIKRIEDTHEHIEVVIDALFKNRSFMMQFIKELDEKKVSVSYLGSHSM